MKYLLLGLIHMYWLLPKRHRRCCLFKQTCSHFVYERSKLYGFVKGFAALKERYRQCRPISGRYTIEDHEFVILADKSVVSGDILNLTTRVKRNSDTS